MEAPSTWVVDRTGDLLHLDGTLSVVEVRAQMVKACNGQADITAKLKAGGLMWCIKGKGFELQALGSVDRALRIAALSSGWRECAPPGPVSPAVAAEAARLYDTVQRMGQR